MLGPQVLGLDGIEEILELLELAGTVPALLLERKRAGPGETSFKDGAGDAHGCALSVSDNVIARLSS
jgi:hypothetical protein